MTNKKEIAKQDDQASEIVERLTGINKSINISLPEETDELWQFTQRKENEAAINLAERGLAYLILKERLGHGAFTKGLQDHSVVPQRAREAMSVAKMLAALPESKRRSIGVLNSGKLLALASIPIEAFDVLNEGGDLDDIDMMSVKEVKALARKQRDDLDKECNARKTAEEKARRLQHRHLEPEGFPYPDSVERVRIESSVLSNQAVACIDDLEQHMIDLTQASDMSRDKVKKLAEFGAGATALYLNIKAIESKAAYLLAWFMESIGEDYITDKPEDVPTMTEAEATRIFKMWELMQAQRNAEKMVRDDARKAKKRGGKKGHK